MPLKNFEHLIVNKKIAVAVSGGADSTALLFFCKKHNLDITALTVDHGLRAESKEEAEKIKAICTSLNIEHHTLNWDSSGALNKMQKASRDARYDLMINFCKSHHIKTLFLAHHQDDLLETFIMRIWQKSGILGLASMSALTEKDGVILARPFLNTPKEKLIDYLKKQNIPYIEDPSNTNKKYLRSAARSITLTPGDRNLFLNFIELLGKIRRYLENYVLAQFTKVLSWEIPCVLKINSLLRGEHDIIKIIFIEKVARLLGFKGFFRSSTTQKIIESLSKGYSIDAYSLYWCFSKNHVYVSPKNKSCLAYYKLELAPITASPRPFAFKDLGRNDCIHLKKTGYINFLFSKTKTLLPSIYFENLIVFLPEIEYSERELKEKGWNLVKLSVKQEPISFIPFTHLSDNDGGFDEQ